ncbi:hypothetical protein KKH15_00040 [Patescibacteria group bacterium]|nr:hypothetical protein [Patescibacteria group bacterium]MBU1754769.1 hypothetical protein [Patescibacteria group bacterium]
MFSIQDLLKRHAIPGLRLSENRRVCAEILTSVTGVAISPKSIQISEGVLSLSIPPVLKSALLLKQTEIIASLQAEGISVTALR